MIQSFDTNVAKLVGTDAAALYNYIAVCSIYNPESMTFDELRYARFTKNGLEQHFYYLEKWEVENAINKLIAQGLIIKVNRIDPERPDFEYYGIPNNDNYDLAL